MKGKIADKYTQDYINQRLANMGIKKESDSKKTTGFYSAVLGKTKKMREFK
ncbi:hypothetical protein [Bacillus mycoides]|uniref:hypothetical protein n=1 Tax=Bacillus mycoides TaxID=1405 RepID=UPI0008940B9F|nr:hypothetical protein [Bacillus mycoides]OFD61469.1 hypothetical protein BWGOE7_38010 [Bacillus mycoides]OFD91907.1 hypothetical protein BWGOE12_38380 [Bacillus mycoides]